MRGRLTQRRPPGKIPRMNTTNRVNNRIARLLSLAGAAGALLGGLAFTARASEAAQLKTKTAEAFEQYIRTSEASMDEEISGGKTFLWIDALPAPERREAYDRLRRGEIVIERFPSRGPRDAGAIPGGLIHDWVGVVFIPGASLPRALAMLQDYDHDADYYRGQVLKSKVLWHAGGEFRIVLRLKRTRIITVIFDTEYDVHNKQLDATHATSESHSTRISEVEDAGTAREHDRPVGDDHGFLWRLDSYWRFREADGGVYVQCRAISLTRDVPAGLGWLVRPFIESIPVESLRSTLEGTRTAIAKPRDGTQASLSAGSARSQLSEP